jgi:AAA+ ATPase superfamily predicted ATPase
MGIALQKLAEEGGFKEIGSWWETKSSTNKERLNSYEIDIVALKSSGKKALIAEVKRMPENNYVHSTFMEKVEHLRHKEMAKYDIETRVLGLEDM